MLWFVEYGKRGWVYIAAAICASPISFERKVSNAVNVTSVPQDYGYLCSRLAPWRYGIIVWPLRLNDDGADDSKFAWELDLDRNTIPKINGFTKPSSMLDGVLAENMVMNVTECAMVLMLFEIACMIPFWGDTVERTANRVYDWY